MCRPSGASAGESVTGGGGGGGAPATANANGSEAVAPDPSVAVTSSCSVVPPADVGAVPLKVPVAASNASQPGNAEPSASVAESAIVSPASAWVNVPAGTANENACPAVAA